MKNNRIGNENKEKFAIYFAKTREIIRNPKIKPSAKALLFDLLLYASINNSCFPSQKTLAGDLGYKNTRQIRNLLNKLRDNGVLEWKQGGFNKSSSYKFKEVYLPKDEIERKQNASCIGNEFPVSCGNDLPPKGVIEGSHSNGVTNNSQEKKKEYGNNLRELRATRTDELRRNYPIVQAAQRLGLVSFSLGNNPGKAVAVSCFNKSGHKNGDKNPSLLLMPNVNRYECKGCGVSGGVIDLVMYAQGIDFKQARLWLDPNIDNFSNELNKSQDYLESRGISKETARRFNLRVSGGKLIIPLPNGGEKYRWINNNDGNKYSCKEGIKPCLFKAGEAIGTCGFLVEGELDAIKLFQETGRSIWTTGSAGNSPKPWLEDFRHFQEIYLCHDNDKTGKKANEIAAHTLGAKRCYIVTLPEGIKDVSEYFQKGYQKADFELLIEQAKPFIETPLLI
jgi:hypothetical protein